MRILIIPATILVFAGVFQSAPLDAGEITQVTFHEANDYHTRWSPDGSEIAFDADTDNGPQSIWIIPAEGGTPRLFDAAGIPSFQPSWSPDGRMIGYVSRETGNSDIYVIEVPEIDLSE
jgi:Tol biopolymer transport system component